MPYYRITIWVKDRVKPYEGIRQIEQSNIDIVFNMIEKEIYTKINESLVIDYEVAMLPKTCTAVKNYLLKMHRKK